MTTTQVFHTPWRTDARPRGLGGDDRHTCATAIHINHTAMHEPGFVTCEVDRRVGNVIWSTAAHLPVCHAS
jgi:hypothetical protein